MSTGFRRGLALLFIVAFLITAPAVVLYTAGYRLNVRNGQLVQTGILSVDSAPRGARVTVDGNAAGVTPSLAKDLLPGPHRLTLIKDGYLPWEKTLSVASQQTTFVNPAVLNADQPATRAKETGIEDTAVARETGRAGYVRRQGAWDEVWSFDPIDGSEQLVARLPVVNGAWPVLAWSADGTSLSATPKGARVSPLTRLGDFSLQPAGDRLAVVQARGSGPGQILAYVPSAAYAFVSAPDGLLALADAGRGRLTVLDQNGGATLLDANAADWQWEPKARRLLYADGHELHLFDPDGRSDDTLTRVSDPITGLAWRPGLPAVLYAQAGQVVSIEFDRRDGRVTQTLVQGSGIRDVWTDTAGKTAYFFGTVGGKTGLYARPLQK